MVRLLVGEMPATRLAGVCAGLDVPLVHERYAVRPDAAHYAAGVISGNPVFAAAPIEG